MFKLYQNDKFNKHNLPDPFLYYDKQGLKLHGSGEWRSAKCPFHRDSKPSFSINIANGGFYCFSCGARGGDVLDFHMKKYQPSFIEAIKELGAWRYEA